MANTHGITNLDINSVTDDGSVKSFSTNWPMSACGLNAKGQFAIVYNGSMCVYDGIPAEKVQEILMMAATTAKSSEVKSGTPFTSLFTSATPSSPQGTSNNVPSPPSVCFPSADKSSICRMQGILTPSLYYSHNTSEKKCV